MSATLDTMGQLLLLLLLALVPPISSQFVQDEDLTALELISPTNTTTTASDNATTTTASSICPCSSALQCISSSILRDETTCLYNRTTPRSDCSCCHVCARQAGQSCDQLDLPCDPGFKLTCVSGICSGVAGLWVDDVTHNGTTVRWRNESWVAVRFSKEFDNSSSWRREEIPSGNNSIHLSALQPNSTYYITLESASNETSEVSVVTTKGARDLNGTWLAEGTTDQASCEQRCYSGVGGNVDCKPRCEHRPGSLTDPLCTETPDPNDPCCVIYVCALKKEVSPAPHLIITGLAPSSISVAWDDFKPPSYEKGYVLEYRVAGHDQQAAAAANWTRLQANNTPMTTVEDLSPNTRYQVRVSIWDEQDSLGVASEIINATTSDGCTRGNKTFRVDDTWFEGCLLRCTCRENASLECSERCQLPLYRADNFPASPWCSPTPDKDPCCVSVQCDASRANSDNEHGSGGSVQTCPTPALLSDPSPCISSCQTDIDCITKEQVCCPTSCGANICTNAAMTNVTDSTMCLNVICGPQAVCHVTDGHPKCQCIDGTQGDPNDFMQGCTTTVTATSPAGTGCNFKNMTYSPGENFFDGCDYRCLCNVKSEIECEPRCLGAGTVLDDPTCRPVRDPDDNCCTVTLCGAQPEASNALKDPTKKDKLEFAVASDGCIYQNKTYQRSEQILEGCTKNCTCRGEGFISCLPRCPITSPPGPNCTSLPDPADHCCNVTICNNTFPEPDVLRDNSSAFHHHHLHHFMMNDGIVHPLNDTLHSESSTTVLTNLSTTPEGSANVTMTMSTEATTTSASMDGERNHADLSTLVMTTTTTMPPSTTEHKEVSNELGSTINALPDEVTKENENKEQRFVNSIVEEKSHFDFIHENHNLTNSVINNITSHEGNNTSALHSETTTVSTTLSDQPTTNIASDFISTLSPADTSVPTSETSPTTSDVSVTTNDVSVTASDISVTASDVSVTTSDDVFSHTAIINNAIHLDSPANETKKHNTTSNSTVPLIVETVNLMGNETDNESDVTGTSPISEKSTISPVSITTNTLVAGSDVTDITATRRMDDDLTTTPLAVSDTPWFFTPFLSGNVLHSATTETAPLAGKSDILVEKKERGRKLDDKHIILNSDVTCEVDGQHIHVGGEVTEGCQRVCRCLEGGKPLCLPLTCPYHQRSEMSGCLDWEYDRTFQPTTGNCCAPANCITKVPLNSGAECSYQGRRFSHLEPIPSNMIPACEKECRCISGNVSCDSICAPVPDTPPPTLVCVGDVEVGLISGDPCCSQWRCKAFTAGPQEEQGDSTFVEFLNPSKKVKKPPPLHETKNPFLVTVSQEEQGDSFFVNGQPPTTMFGVPQEEQGDSFSVNGQPPPSIFGEDNPNFSTLTINPSFEDQKCETENGSRSVGEQWEAEPSCQTRRCACVLLSNGTTSVECTGGCSHIEKYLRPTEGCPKPVLVTPDDPCYCPYVMCNKADQGSNVQNMTAVAMNATSVRVSLSIPKIYVGLYGLVELLYTADATRTNTSTWDKEVFSHRDDLFSEAQLQHDVHGLQPDTTYYIKANVMLRDNSNTATSTIVNVHTPNLPITSTSSTPPPHLNLDFNFKVEDRLSTSLSVSWRPLSPLEKRYVDGLQVKFRIQGEETWSVSPMLHRDVTTFLLRDLKPNTAYELEMGVVTAEDEGIEADVAGPTVFYTSPKHDDYAFNITLTADKVLVTAVELHWSGVPFPMHKYVNLYAIYYKTDKMSEPQSLFRPPKVEQVSVDELKPGNRYQIWMDAYLSNGDVRKSNTLEVITKPGVASKQPEKAQLDSSPPEGTTSAEANSSNSYYEALIAVAVVAAICVLGFITLLVLLLRRQAHSTAPITAHKSQSAYDNPTYKPSYDGEIENGKPLTAT